MPQSLGAEWCDLNGMNRIWRKKNLHEPGQWLLLARRSHYNAHALADICGVTMRQLERYFEGDLGRTPQDWLNEQRMVAARYLLMESPQVKAVGLKLGYKRLSHFSRDFKRCYGFTPSTFRDSADVPPNSISGGF
jgi:AraC-like DNA-binding protein